MKKVISLLLSLVVLLTTFSYTIIVQADSNVEVNISLFREIPSGTINYIERMLYSNSNIGTEIRIKNNNVQPATIKPFAAIYYNNILKSIKTQEYTLNSGEETLYKPKFFIPDENIANYTIKYFVWSNNMQPIINPITINNTYSDYYGDSFEYAIFVTEGKTIEGKINTSSEADYVKFIAQNTGAYTISAYGSSLSGYLYNSGQSLISSNSGNGCYTLNANLTAGQAYFIKTSGTLSSDYSILIQDNQKVADFDIYQYDSEIKGYKDNIISLCEKAYDDNNPTLSQEIYNKYEQAYDTDLLLHEMPDSLKNLSKDSSTYDANVKTYYASKKSEFQALRQTYIDLYSEYEYSTGGGSPFPPGVIAPSSDFEPDSNFSTVERGMLDGTVVETEKNEIALMSNTQPSLTITSKTETSVTFNAVFPVSGASGNTFEFIDFNQGQTIDTWQYDIDKNGSQYNNWNERSKSYTISNLIPGGMYYIVLCWSTDGGQLSGGPNSIYRRIQLPPMTDQNLTSTSGAYVTSNIESNDKAIATTTNYKKWLNNMDSVYLSLKELTGYTPYNGRKIQIKSTREDMNEYNPDGVNYWMITWGWSGNPILISRPFYRSLMQRLSSGDWGDVMIHELSHDFDNYDWCFDNEVLADLKLSYVLQTKSASKIYRPDTNKYYTGSNIYDFFNTDQADSYQYSFADGWYHSRGMTAIMLRIKSTIGWDAFKNTFRYMSDLSSDEEDYIYSSSSRDPEMGKFNIFMTKLRDYSRVDVISKLSSSEKRIIESRYGGTISYYIAPPPVISGGSSGGGSTVNIQPGEYTVRRFIPESSGNYDIYTSPFGGTGVSNDTVIEVYNNETLTSSDGSNDDYGSSRFSKVTVNLSAYQTYYIKLRHYNNSGEIHADLKVTKNITPISLRTNSPVNVQVAALEYSTLSFTPTTSGQYLFTSGQYNGITQTTNKDSVLTLYRNEALTNRIVSSQYVSGAFPQISAELTAGVTYYLTFTGYLNKVARARITVTGSLSSINGISNLDYNNGNDPMLGYSNTLSFNINRNDATSATYYVVPNLGWDDINFYEKTANATTITLNDTSTLITIPDIAITSGGGSILYTKIKIYNNDSANKTLLWESKSVAKSRSNYALSKLEFIKDENSSYIYVNNPEFITKFDVVDDVNINKLKLFEQKKVDGKNTYYQTHITHATTNQSVTDFPTGDFYVDVDFYNPNDNEVSINISKLAYGTLWSYPVFGEDDMSILKKYISGDDTLPTINIPSKSHKLLFDQISSGSRLKMSGSDYDRMCLMFDFEVSGGEITISSLAAKNRSNLVLANNSDNTLHDGSSISNGEVITDGRLNEFDIYDKYKGIAKNQSNQINANLNFIIDDNTECSNLQVQMTDPYYKELGVWGPSNYWLTEASPTYGGWDTALYAMPENLHRFTYHYRDTNRKWYFDFEHRNGDYYIPSGSDNIPLNEKVEDSILNKMKSDVYMGINSFGGAPDSKSLGMGSWGVVYHYTITISNIGIKKNHTVDFKVDSTNYLLVGNRTNSNTNYTFNYYWKDDGIKTPVTINIPTNSTTILEIVTLYGLGSSGLFNQLILN